MSYRFLASLIDVLIYVAVFTQTHFFPVSFQLSTKFIIPFSSSCTLAQLSRLIHSFSDGLFYGRAFDMFYKGPVAFGQFSFPYMLKKAGYEIIAGAKHDKAIHKETGKMIAIPRHKGDIPIGTAYNILKKAGLK